jgi:DNA-binding transcriptional regulator YdaS (Cro superfamily)
MESLYVCLFSNGHIKVGRSLEPMSRIAAHADRVACMGVEVAQTFTVECAGAAVPCEQKLICLCAGYPGATRYQGEWFSGIEFDLVCQWAGQCAAEKHEEPEANGLRRYLESLPLGGMTKFAKDLGMSKSQLSQYASSWRGAAPGPALCVRIERLSEGKVTRRELRSDWRDIWPELA